MNYKENHLSKEHLENYTQAEQNKINQLDELFDKWEDNIDENMKNNDFEGKRPFFVRDGLFPHFTDKKCKILFIGRESLSKSESDLTIIDKYKINNPIDNENKTLNQDPYRRIPFYLSYALQHNSDNYENFPSASEIAEKAFTENENSISFALMNVSKFSNDSETSANVDKDLMMNFWFNSFNQNIDFFKEELKIIQPDIIITCDLGGINYWPNLLDEDYKTADITFEEDILPINGDVYEIHIDGISHVVPVIDSYRFSARKPIKKCFVEPLIRVAREYGLLPKIQ
jgi:hypothetical protein